MKTFKELKEELELLEAINPDTIEDAVESKPTSLFLGRMQPIHKGHDAIIKKMNNPIVVLVKGAKSSQDKERNPLDAEYQTKLIKMLNPKVDVFIAKTGYIPTMVNEYRKKGIEVSEILAGNDRIKGYQGMIASFNKQMPDEKKINVTFTETPRVTSATDVRNAIRGDDFDTFKKLVPKKLHSEWENLKEKLAL